MIIELKLRLGSIYTTVIVIWSANDYLELFNLPTEDNKHSNNMNRLATTLASWIDWALAHPLLGRHHTDRISMSNLRYWGICFHFKNRFRRSQFRPIWGSSDVTIRIKAICGLFQMIKMKPNCNGVIWNGSITNLKSNCLRPLLSLSRTMSSYTNSSVSDQVCSTNTFLA